MVHPLKWPLFALPALTLLAAPALAGQYVEWKDDGTVLLKLGEAYNNQVITTSREELGSEFGPDKQPFKDVTITVTVNGAGPKGGISGPLYQFRPIWEELSGGKVNIVELPFAEHYTKMMLDLRNGTGQYDAFMSSVRLRPTPPRPASCSTAWARRRA